VRYEAQAIEGENRGKAQGEIGLWERVLFDEEANHVAGEEQH